MKTSLDKNEGCLYVFVWQEK